VIVISIAFYESIFARASRMLPALAGRIKRAASRPFRLTPAPVA
jgi:hypothetical protein